MPRRSSGKSASRPAPRSTPVRNSPQPVKHAPPPARVQSSSGGIGSTIAEGIAFGAANEVAHRIVGALFGPRTIRHETVVSEAASAPAPIGSAMGSDACNVHSKEFQDCLNSNDNEISKCQFYMDMLAECKRNSGSMMSA